MNPARGFRPAVVAAVLTMVTVSSAVAQQVRVTGTATLRYIELRTLARDSVAAALVPGEGLLRRLPDGRTVRCVPDDLYCRYAEAADRVAAVPLVHDLEASVWGLGRGVRAYGQLRARTAWGSGAGIWPQAQDPVDVLAAFAELDRPRYRVRAGRQWQVSGLGFYNFDGINAGVAPVRGAWVEAWAGRSLVRGMNEARAGGALEAIEAEGPPVGGVLFGVHARYRPSSRLAAGAAYQVDFRDDGTGLHAELAAVDAAYYTRAGSAEFALELDIATSSLNEAALRLRSMPLHGVVLHADVRRYRPYFELWTIWGAFSPVGFDEVRGGAAWTSGSGGLLIGADASYRAYGGGASNALDVFREQGWSLAVRGGWVPGASWRLDGAWRVEAGFGAARRDGHAGVTRLLGDAATLTVQALAFQRLYEFRLDEGTIYGLTGELSLRLGDRLNAFAGAAAYRHGSGGNAVDWNQRRGMLRLQWTLGTEPGLPPLRQRSGS
jgi:hypothetical protein